MPLVARKSIIAATIYGLFQGVRETVSADYLVVAGGGGSSGYNGGGAGVGIPRRLGAHHGGHSGPGPPAGRAHGAGGPL